MLDNVAVDDDPYGVVTVAVDNQSREYKSNAVVERSKLCRVIEVLKRQCKDKDGEIFQLHTEIGNLKCSNTQGCDLRVDLAETLEHLRSTVLSLRNENEALKATVALNKQSPNNVCSENSKAALTDGSTAKYEELLRNQTMQLMVLKESLRKKTDEINVLQYKLSTMEKSWQQRLGANEDRMTPDMEHVLNKRKWEYQRDVDSLLLGAQHGTSMVTLAQQHSKNNEREVEENRYEIETKDKIILYLKEDARSKEKQIECLKQQMNDLCMDAAKNEKALMAATEQHKADAEARIALNAAELESKVTENENLLNKVSELEDRLNLKDEELTLNHLRVPEYDAMIMDRHRELNAAKYELNLKEIEINQLQKLTANREIELKKEAQQDREQQEELMIAKFDNLQSIIDEKESTIEQLKNEFSECKYQFDSKCSQLNLERNHLADKSVLVKQLRERLADLEEQLFINNRNQEMESLKTDFLKKSEEGAKQRVVEQQAELEIFQQDSILLQKARAENVDRQRQIHDLQRALTQRQSSSVVEGKRNLMTSSNCYKEQSPSGLTPIKYSSGDGITGGFFDSRFRGTNAIGNTISAAAHISNISTEEVSNNPLDMDKPLSDFDLIDQRLMDVLSRLPERLRVVKQTQGVYLLGNRIVSLKYINGLLMAQLGTKYVDLFGFLTSELSNARSATSISYT